jgi:hypothetical protein
VETLDPAALAVWDMGRAKVCRRIRQLHSAGICLTVPEIPLDLSFLTRAPGSMHYQIPVKHVGGRKCTGRQHPSHSAWRKDSTDKHPGRNMIAPGPVWTPKKTLPDSLSTTGLAVSMDLIRTQL